MLQCILFVASLFYSVKTLCIQTARILTDVATVVTHES